MPRSIYYQDAGNPIQRSRLPATRPTVVLPIPPLPLGKACVALAWIALVWELVLLFIPPLFAGASQMWWFSLLMVALFVVLFLSWAICFWKPHNSSAALLVLAAFALLLLLPTDFVSRTTATAVAISWFAWLFARHWLSVCTTSPRVRSKVLELRATWRMPLALLAFGPALLIVAGAWFGHLQLAVLIVGAWCWLNLYIVPAPESVSKSQILWDSFIAWYTCNPDYAGALGPSGTPQGECLTRIAYSCVIVVLVGLSFAKPAPAIPKVEKKSARHNFVAYATVQEEPVSKHPAQLKESWTLILWPIASNVLQLLTALVVPLLLVLPVMADAGQYRQIRIGPANWHDFIQELQHSPDPIERRSYYQGELLSDRTPLLVPRNVYFENAHFAGDCGGGKTALALAPFIEQTVSFGDCSLIVIDLKADSLELLATLTAAAEAYYERTGWRMPLKYFTNRSNRSTYAFNPLSQPYWDDCDPYIQTDILCGAMGLSYGSDYAKGWYSEANAAVLHYAIEQCPGVRTLRELAEKVKHVISSAKKRDLHPELRNAGIHVQALLERLGSFEALNVGPQTGHPRDVIEQAIDLRDLFHRPQLLHFDLSSALAPSSSPEIARLLVYSTLCAATQTKRQCPVFIVIDEFQRMVAHNVEYMLQLARSMGVGFILANQSLEDLGDLIPAVEANCRYRQWFSISSLDDRRRLIESSGETVEKFLATTSPANTLAALMPTETISEQVMQRFSHNDISLASDHPLQSIVRISRGSGYAQFGGLPFVVESTYHISAAEYARRKSMPWPEPTLGTFIPREYSDQTGPSKSPAPSPIITTEIIDSNMTKSSSPPRRRRRLEGEGQ